MTTTVNTTAGNSNNKEVIICDCCGCEIEAGEETYETADGLTICKTCRDEEYFICEDCGKLHPLYDAVEVLELHNGRTIINYICEDCQDSNSWKYKTCEDCGNVYKRDFATFVHGIGWICDDCLGFGSEYDCCEGCGEWYHYDDLHYNEDNGCSYCDDCYEDYALYNHVHGCHEGPVLPMRNQTNDKMTVGFELELNGGRTGDFVDDIYKRDILDDIKYKAEEDGSLDDGVEIISAPFGVSLAPRVFDEIEDICKAARSANMKTDDQTGLHVHINKSYFSTSNNNMQFYLAMGLLEHELINWSTDSDAINYEDYTGRSLNSWCEVMSYGDELERKVLRVLSSTGFKTGWEQREELHKALLDLKAYYKEYKSHGTHNEGINAFSSHGTVEFRFCAASIYEQEVKERIQFVVGLAGWARDMSKLILEQFDNCNYSNTLLARVFDNKALMTTGANVLNAGLTGIHKIGKGLNKHGYNIELLKL